MYVPTDRLARLPGSYLFCLNHKGVRAVGSLRVGRRLNSAVEREAEVWRSPILRAGSNR